MSNACGEPDGSAEQTSAHSASARAGPPIAIDMPSNCASSGNSNRAESRRRVAKRNIGGNIPNTESSGAVMRTVHAEHSDQTLGGKLHKRIASNAREVPLQCAPPSPSDVDSVDCKPSGT